MNNSTTRRRFLKLGGAAASLVTAKVGQAAGAGQRIAIETDDESPMVRSDVVQWAIRKLREAMFMPRWYPPNVPETQYCCGFAQRLEPRLLASAWSGVAIN